MKLEVGDLVRVIAKDVLWNGKVGVIIEVDEGVPVLYHVQHLDNNHKRWYLVNELEEV